MDHLWLGKGISIRTKLMFVTKRRHIPVQFGTVSLDYYTNCEQGETPEHCMRPQGMCWKIFNKAPTAAFGRGSHLKVQNRYAPWIKKASNKGANKGAGGFPMRKRCSMFQRKAKRYFALPVNVHVLLFVVEAQLQTSSEKEGQNFATDKKKQKIPGIFLTFS